MAVRLCHDQPESSLGIRSVSHCYGFCAAGRSIDRPLDWMVFRFDHHVLAAVSTDSSLGHCSVCRVSCDECGAVPNRNVSVAVLGAAAAVLGRWMAKTKSGPS